MKKLEVKQMENLEGGTNRQCFIDGALTAAAIMIGGGWLAVVGGVYAGNSNNCF